MRLDPDNAEAYCKRGFTYEALSKYSQALVDYTKAVEIDPNYANACNSKGNIYKILNKFS